MTKPNIKKLKEEIKRKFETSYQYEIVELDHGKVYTIKEDLLWFVLEQVKEFVKQVIESVSVKEDIAGIKTTQWLIDYGITDEDIFTAGQVEEIVTNYYSDIVQEIKQWKKDMLERLK